jgi:archaellum component FlaC
MSADQASIDEGDLNQFREQVKEYLRLPTEIQDAEEPVKQLKARYKELNNDILEFMKDHGLTYVNIPEEVGGGSLMVQNSIKKEAIKKENWSKGINEFLRKRGIQATYDDVEDEVNNTRETKAAMTLKKRKK